MVHQITFTDVRPGQKKLALQGLHFNHNQTPDSIAQKIEVGSEELVTIKSDNLNDCNCIQKHTE